jgi:hypothetical protein
MAGPFKTALLIDFLLVCLRRLTFSQQQEKVSKKCRPSSAGRADFSQITFGDAQRNIAYNLTDIKI